MDEPRTTLSGRWRVVVEEVLTGMADWRAAHPTATFAELEVEVEARLGELRARMLEEAALARGADAAETEERPPCPACGGPLVARGQQTRQVRVRGDRQVALRRPYLSCTACGRGFFPPR
jgi:YgiT-type zinc finger domain-containing protein